MYAVNGFKRENYNMIFTNLLGIQNQFLDYLIKDSNVEEFKLIRQKRKDIFKNIIEFKNLFNEREKDSIISVKNEMFLSMEKLNGLKLHNTPISLRKYCLIFIYISPFLFNTKLISENQFQIFLGIDIPVSVLFSMLISFILMALYNIQDYIENPFDQKGLDDLKINELKIQKEENLYH
jgi:predicted membrane chloride channel (bestrophin family)